MTLPCPALFSVFSLPQGQRGGFSPFMFGMLMATAIFSVVVSHWARQELVIIEQRRIEREKKAAEDIQNAFENAILTETSSTYSANLNLARAVENTAGATGKTRSGQAYQLSEVSATTTLGLQHQRVLFTTSDDTYLRNDIASQTTAAGMVSYTAGQNQAVAAFDSEAVRGRQLKQSKEYLDAEASQIYLFYANNGFRFPDANEYAALNARTRLRDAWGSPFTYTYVSDTQATLSFTTPWGRQVPTTLTTD